MENWFLSFFVFVAKTKIWTKTLNMQALNMLIYMTKIDKNNSTNRVTPLKKLKTAFKSQKRRWQYWKSWLIEISLVINNCVHECSESNVLSQLTSQSATPNAIPGILQLLTIICRKNTRWWYELPLCYGIVRNVSIRGILSYRLCSIADWI